MADRPSLRSPHPRKNIYAPSESVCDYVAVLMIKWRCEVADFFEVFFFFGNKKVWKSPAPRRARARARACVRACVVMAFFFLELGFYLPR